MGRLIYAMQTSLDGYVNDEEGEFGWARPDAEVHSFFNELERANATALYGRRMYEVMRYWQDPPDLAEAPPHIREYAEIWQAAEKVVYSKSLDSVSTPQTCLEHDFDPEAVRRLKEDSTGDLGIGGPTLAAEALRAGLVDELHQVIYPVIVGGGTAWLPDGLRLELELVDEHGFAGGAVHLHYRARA